VNITNDAWFGESAAPYQHIATAALRAVENRVPIVRAANTGITGVIDPTGRILQPTELFVRTQIVGEVLPRGERLSPYAAYGDLFAYLSSAIALVALGVSEFGRRRRWRSRNDGSP
jgi:apolipoprotein N-acyltransferase